MAHDPAGLAAWFVAGLIVGFLTASGALVGGLLFGSLLPGSSAGWIGSLVVACTGTVSLLVSVRAVAPRYRLGL